MASPRADKQAFEEIVRAGLPRLYALARRLVARDEEDLVQETLLRAYRSFDELRAREAAQRWLQAILVNVFRDRLRRSGGAQEVAVEEIEDFSLYQTIAEEDPLPYSDTVHLDFLGAFGKEDVRAVLLRLPELYRVPLVLRYMEGFSPAELEELLDAPRGTVLARLHRARKLFEREMWRYAQENALLEQEVV